MTEHAIPSVIGLAKLAKMSFDDADMAPLWQQLTAQFTLDSEASDARQKMLAALMDMCLIDQMRGSPERGLGFQAQALDECRLYQIPAQTQPTAFTLLGFVIGGKINANTPIEFLLEGAAVTLYLLYVVPGKPLPPVPEHDVAITLISDSEEARPVLRELERLTEYWPRPFLNRPGQIPQIGRECLFKLLAPIAGVSIPPTDHADRPALRALSAGGFPMIVRPLDSHAGDGLEKLSCPAEAEDYLDRHPETDFHVSPFQDYRSADGQYRKYRIIMVDGEPFPCHMGISDHWMIHYVNAGMAESAEKRREEEQFFTSFHQEFGYRHRYALCEIARTLDLDYFGIDCAEMPDGRLLVFEAGTALVVHAMDSPEVFGYKRSPMHALFAAFQDLLCRRRSECPL